MSECVIFVYAAEKDKYLPRGIRSDVTVILVVRQRIVKQAVQGLGQF